MYEFFEFILYGAMYVGIGIAVLILLPAYTLHLSSKFLFKDKDDDMQSILFTMLFFLSTLFLMLDIFSFRSLGIAVYGYASCFIFYIVVFIHIIAKIIFKLLI